MVDMVDMDMVDIGNSGDGHGGWNLVDIDMLDMDMVDTKTQIKNCFKDLTYAIFKTNPGVSRISNTIFPSAQQRKHKYANFLIT